MAQGTIREQSFMTGSYAPLFPSLSAIKERCMELWNSITSYSNLCLTAFTQREVAAISPLEAQASIAGSICVITENLDECAKMQARCDALIRKQRARMGRT